MKFPLERFGFGLTCSCLITKPHNERRREDVPLKLHFKHRFSPLASQDCLNMFSMTVEHTDECVTIRKTS